MTEVVAWAASNGDRSENADYQYGKRRLRQIDGRIRFLRKRIEAAEVVDPETPRTGQAATRAFFGATVRYAKAVGVERVVSIVGTDEVGRVTAADLAKNRHQNLTIDTHGDEDDFLVVFARRPAADKAIEKWLAKDKAADPRLVVWAPAQVNDQERAQLAEVLAKLKLYEENKDSAYGEGDAQMVEFSPAFPYQAAFFFLTNQQGSCWNQYKVRVSTVRVLSQMICWWCSKPMRRSPFRTSRVNFEACQT